MEGKLYNQISLKEVITSERQDWWYRELIITMMYTFPRYKKVARKLELWTSKIFFFFLVFENRQPLAVRGLESSQDQIIWNSLHGFHVIRIQRRKKTWEDV